MIKYILTHKYVVSLFVACVVFVVACIHWQSAPPDIQVGGVVAAQPTDIVLDDTNIQVPQASPSSPWFYPLLVSAIMIVNTAVTGYFETKRKNFAQLEQQDTDLKLQVERLEKEKDDAREKRILDLEHTLATKE